MSNTRPINKVFGRNTVMSHEPDNSWPLSNELMGVEIEVEDLRGSWHILEPEWTVHNDGSLRNGIEFVLSSPSSGKTLSRAISKFFESGLSYNISDRTSTHIHINASDNMTYDQFRNMFVIMYLIEPAVFRWADENRKWCGYCSPLTDLSPTRLIPLLTDDSGDAAGFVRAVQGNGQNSERYYGYNLAAFARHGTVEFRYFPCTTSRQDLTAWINFVMRVKKAARACDSPAAILNDCTTRDKLTSFISSHFQDQAEIICRGLDMDDAVGRVRDLLAVLSVPASSINSTRNMYSTTSGAAFQKFLTVGLNGNHNARPVEDTEENAIFDENVPAQRTRDVVVNTLSWSTGNTGGPSYDFYLDDAAERREAEEAYARAVRDREERLRVQREATEHVRTVGYGESTVVTPNRQRPTRRRNPL